MLVGLPGGYLRRRVSGGVRMDRHFLMASPEPLVMAGSVVLRQSGRTVFRLAYRGVTSGDASEVRSCRKNGWPGSRSSAHIPSAFAVLGHMLAEWGPNLTKPGRRGSNSRRVGSTLTKTNRQTLARFGSVVAQICQQLVQTDQTWPSMSRVAQTCSAPGATLRQCSATLRRLFDHFGARRERWGSAFWIVWRASLR